MERLAFAFLITVMFFVGCDNRSFHERFTALPKDHQDSVRVILKDKDWVVWTQKSNGRIVREFNKECWLVLEQAEARAKLEKEMSTQPPRAESE